MTPLYEQVEAAANAIRRLGAVIPQVAIVLGSGLGAFADSLADAISTPYGHIAHWPVANVIGHEGRLVVGRVGGDQGLDDGVHIGSDVHVAGHHGDGGQG